MLAVVAMSLALRAQTSAAYSSAVKDPDFAPVHQISAGRSASWEYGVQVSGGVGLEDRTNYSFLNAGVHAGKVLTANYGSGVLRGNFEYGVEVIPFWQS